MKHLFNIIWLTGFVSLLSFTGRGQDFHFVEHPLFERYDPIETLSIYEDSSGMIWLGTEKGLYYFDGLNFRKIALGKGSPYRVTALYQAVSGEMWIGTSSGEIFTANGFDPGHPVNWEEGHPKVPITGFGEDKQGRLWIGTYGEGVYLKDKYLINFGMDDELPSNDIYDLAADSLGRIWIATDNGIAYCQYTAGKKVIKKYGKEDGLNDEIIKSIYICDDGNIWLGTHQKGVVKFNEEEGRFVSIAQEDWQYGEITDLIEFEDLDLWIGTKNNGVVRYDYELGQYMKVQGQDDLPNSGINAIIKAGGETVWMAGNLIPLLQTNRKFEFYHTEDINIQAIACSRSSCLWLGAQEGLYRLTFENGVQKLDVIPGFDGINVTSLYFCSGGRLWVGTFEHGIIIYEPATGLKRQITEKEGLTNNNVLSISGDSVSVWLATLGGVSRLYNPGAIYEEGEIRLESYGADSELGTNYIYQSFVNGHGKVWFATDGDGVSYYQNGHFHTIYKADSTKISSIYSITEDSRDRLWFSTSSHGIFIKDGDEFVHLSPEEMQFSPDILSMQPTKNNSVIIVHPTGLDEIHNDLWSITYYGKEVGLEEFKPNLNSSFSDYRGNIYIGSRGELVKFVHLPNGRIREPELVMRHVQLFDEKIETQAEANFPYDRNYLSFEFSGLWYTHPNEVFYKYMLEGYEMDWNYTSDQRVSYSRLPPGDYTFKIAAIHHLNPIQEDDYYSWSFTIELPFWQQWWFIGLLLLTGAGIVYMIVKEREKNVEREAAYRKAKVESELQTLKNQINPHFLFNSFNVLMNYIEDDPATAVTYVENLSDFYRKILQYRDQDMIPLKEELELISNYYYLLKRRFGDNLTMDIEVDKNIDAYVPPMSLQILVENAVKHNIVSHAKPLHISIKKSGDDYLEIVNNLQVKTNGRANSTGFGLGNISKRYKLLTNKEVHIKKTGDMFIVNMPLIKNGKYENFNRRR